MSKRPVHSKQFWKQRLEAAGVHSPSRYRAVYDCSPDLWVRIQAAHQAILEQYVREFTSILDVGCGWGRLLGMMPPNWKGYYAGVDLSPDFVALARREHPGREFYCSPVEAFVTPRRFGLAVLVSVRGMILREQGEVQWNSMRDNLSTMAERALYLEYDPQDPGSLELLRTSPA